MTVSELVRILREYNNHTPVWLEVQGDEGWVCGVAAEVVNGPPGDRAITIRSKGRPEGA